MCSLVVFSARYTNWGDYEPRDNENDCVIYTKEIEKWSVANCSEMHHFMCERDRGKNNTFVSVL